MALTNKYKMVLSSRSSFNQTQKRMTQGDRIYLVKGLTSKDEWFWKKFWDPQTDHRPSCHFTVTATSHNAIPSNTEMNKIAKLAPSVFFPPAIFHEVRRGAFDGDTFDVTPIIDGQKPRSIIFLDKKISRVTYHATRIHVRDGGCAKIIILDKSVLRMEHYNAAFEYAVGG
jgi:hypothetical protein